MEMAKKLTGVQGHDVVSAGQRAESGAGGIYCVRRPALSSVVICGGFPACAEVQAESEGYREPAVLPKCLVLLASRGVGWSRACWGRMGFLASHLGYRGVGQFGGRAFGG
jgi:hypothetical protein